ncbi:DUF6204 family protein [Streptomyces angustmyceticus]|uniref:DUF6204 family protein n=1 Tax=Streptomyces angustmyceticus TaxID=285578 RepID=UPI003D91E758
MATQHTYRVIVRGKWDGLTQQSRTELLATMDDNDLARLRFTPEGTLAYDRALHSFSYRFVIVSDAADGEEMAAALAEDKAEQALRGAGLGYRELRSTVTDMDAMKINRKSR